MYSASIQTSSKNSDKLIGILITFGVAASLACVFTKIYNWTSTSKNPTKKSKELKEHIYQQFRQGNEQNSNLERHYGSCHCGLQQFAVEAPSELAALECPSQIRYPYILVQRAHFHMTQDESLRCYFVGISGNQAPVELQQKLANQEVATVAGKGVTLHLFCSVCGTHMAHVPSVPSDSVHVNVNCLKRDKVKSLAVAVHNGEYSGPGIGEALPLDALGEKSVSSSFTKPLQQKLAELELKHTENNSVNQLFENAFAGGNSAPVHPAVQMVQFMTARENSRPASRRSSVQVDGR